jgi:cytochrome b
MMLAEFDSVAAGATNPQMVRVWDPFVRVFHWSLAGLFAFAFVTGGEWKNAHVLAGYAIAALVAMRIAWGLIGSRHARFASFVFGPRTTLAFLRDTVTMRAERYLGHNPAGGAMVVTLLVALAVIASTGYAMTTDAFWGVEWIEDLHVGTVYLTLGLIALHVGGVLLASIEHGENLVRAMITGLKRRG